MAAADSVPELSPSNPSIGRIYSGDIDASPFTSNLVTPTDEDLYLEPGIPERFDVANTLPRYFASRGSQGETHKTEEITSSETAKEPQLDKALNVLYRVESEFDGILQINDQDELKNGFANTFDSAETITTISSAHSIRRPRGISFYNLPNDHIVVQEPSIESDAEFEAHPGGNGSQLPGDPNTILIVKSSDAGTRFWPTGFGAFTFRVLFVLAISVICFLPWCMGIGGALILSPENLELLTFRSGYLPSVSAIRRYAHWSLYAFQYVFAFPTAVSIMARLFPTLAFMVIGALLAHLCIAWGSFLFDHNMPLGEGDRQTVYILMTTTWFNNIAIGIGNLYHPVPINPWLEAAREEDGVSDDEGTS